MKQERRTALFLIISMPFVFVQYLLSMFYFLMHVVYPEQWEGGFKLSIGEAKVFVQL
jgi:hypothetical protein